MIAITYSKPLLTPEQIIVEANCSRFMIIDPETGYTNIHHKRELVQTVTPVKCGKYTPEKDNIIFDNPHHYSFQISCFKT